MKRIFFTLIAITATISACCQSRTIELDSPSMRVYLPDPAIATGRAVVACPGGGYTHLAKDHEGYDWAPFYNKLGIAYAVVCYRFPKGNPDLPVTDAANAVKIMRDSAEVWGINPFDIGIMGSSAGGHLASTVATHADSESRPDFQILFYPVITMDKSYTHLGSHDNLIGKDATPEQELLYSNEKQVTDKTPRAFIAFSDDDTVVPPMNGINYYTSQQRSTRRYPHLSFRRSRMGHT